MPQINEDASLQTVLTTFETSPATCADLMAELRAAYSEFISKQPGFVGAALHVNDAQTRVANYSQWRNRDDFKNMLKTRKCGSVTRGSTRSAVGSSRSCTMSSRPMTPDRAGRGDARRPIRGCRG
jgi:heme-degrading monooxygenase HmoA